MSETISKETIFFPKGYGPAEGSPVEPCVFNGRLHQAFLRAVLIDAVPGGLPAPEFGHLVISDRTYAPIARQQLAVLRDWTLERLPLQPTFTAESFDCDDFAMLLKSFASLFAHEIGAVLPFALGIVWGRFAHAGDRLHAANIAVLNSGEVLWIEPQHLLRDTPEQVDGSWILPPPDAVTRLLF